MTDKYVLREHLPLLGTYVAPRTPTECKLAEIWGDAFRMEQVGIEDRYQDLGGDSLLAATIFSDIEDVFKIDLPTDSIVEAPTIERLARTIDELCQSMMR